MNGILIASALLLGCGEEACEDVVLSDANNYAFIGDIEIPVYPTATGEDIEVCWGSLRDDLKCHEMDPTDDIDNVGLVRFSHLSQEQVEAGVNADSLKQADVSGYVEAQPAEGATCADLGDMSFFGSEVDILTEYYEGGGTYLYTLSTGLTPGVGSRSLIFLEPSVDSDVTRVDVGDACGMLEVDVDLTSLQATQLCDAGPWTVDWSGLTLDGQGQELISADVDMLMIGFYEGWSREDLEANFLDIEIEATKLYQADHPGGTRADLSQLVDADGAAFDGLGGDGVWIFALRCSLCYNPAPLFLTVLEPIPEE